MCYAGDQIKNEMGGACGTYREEETCIQSFWWENMRERDHLENLSVDGG